MICDIKKSLRLANEVFTNGKSPVGAPNFLLALRTITFSGSENILRNFKRLWIIISLGWIQGRAIFCISLKPP